MKTETTIDQILAQAYARGHARGMADYAAGYGTLTPLSGQWAGESVPELLGDLILKLEALTHDYPDAVIYDEIADSYEKGYWDGNNVHCTHDWRFIDKYEEVMRCENCGHIQH